MAIMCRLLCTGKARTANNSTNGWFAFAYNVGYIFYTCIHIELIYFRRCVFSRQRPFWTSQWVQSSRFTTCWETRQICKNIDGRASESTLIKLCEGLGFRLHSPLISECTSNIYFKNNISLFLVAI